MKAAIIFNPTAGQGIPAWQQNKIEKEFRKYNIEFQIYETKMSGEGETFAREAVASNFDLIIAAGGDGTVNEVSNGLANTGRTMGILPLGTVNVLARELNIPLDIKKAIRNLAEGVERKYDLGVANGRYFTLMAGFGFDAEVVSTVLQPIKDIIGASAYVIKGLEKLATYNATEVTLEMADQTYTTKAFLVIVANASTYTYRLKIAPYASMNDGLLDVCVFERPISDKLGFMRQLTDVFMNRHLEHDEVSYFRTTKLRVLSDPNVAVQIDGDAYGTTPVDIHIAPGILPIIVPE